MSEDMRKNLRDMLDELDRYFEDFENDIQDAMRQRFAGAKPFSKPFVAGFQMRIGPEGKPSIQFFGNNPLQADGSRSPMSEQIVDERAGTLRVVMDMPGVEKEDIQITAAEESVGVKAERGQRKYGTEVNLRAKVDPDTGKAEFKNGVLDISFSLKDKANKAFRRVNVV
jgi:HSP20 family protein